jgi:polyhydroxyalkanoate synthesis regulator phasin
MATKKRAPRRRGLVQQAVKAGRRALRDAESRVPADLRKQLERTINDGQKALQTAIRQLEAQVRRTARQADVDTALKRLESLSRQVQDLARRAAPGAPKRSAARATRKPAARKPAARTRRTAAAVKKAAAPKPATRRAAARKAPAATAVPKRVRSRASRPRAAVTEVHTVPAPPQPGPVPESVES